MSRGNAVDHSFYETLSSLPVACPTSVKVKEQARKFEEAAQISQASAGHPSSNNEKDTYGLKILGCNAPGISERPLSAASRLGSAPNDEAWTPYRDAAWTSRILSTTDENGDITEISDDFQKLKIARNCQQTDVNHSSSISVTSLSREEQIAAATNGVTIESLSTNTVVVVPETHRSSQCSSRGGRPITGASSAGETQIYPVQKSKIQARRRRLKRTEPSVSNHGFHKSLPDECKRADDNPNKVVTYESDEPSDVGADVDKDYGCAPPSAGSTFSTHFGLFELNRPETTSSEVLADGALASEEDKLMEQLMTAFNIEEKEDWYNPPNEEDDDSSKNKMLQLVKMFYKRNTTSSLQGAVYTYKLLLQGLHNRLEDFVLLPCPPGFVLKTRVTRVKRGISGRFYPVYYMHLEREGPGDRKCLMLVAKKTSSFRSLSYVLSTDPSELNENSEYCVGKIISNFIGTEFTLHSGRSICSHIPLEKGALLVVPKAERFKEELATVIYDPNVLGFKGPRKIKTIIPRLKNVLEREEIRPRISEESLLNQYMNEESDSIITLRNKDPLWNRETHSYILNFAGRVSTASVKNFQIVRNDQDDQILLQFGRASENTFSLDFQFPFCPLQAFAIALTSFDSKLACE